MNQQRTIDLTRLALERADKAVATVTQLMEDEREIYSVLTAVSASMFVAAVGCALDGIEKQNGKRPDAANVVGYMVQEFFRNLGDNLGVLGVEVAVREEVIKK
jgi:hypothetical protein